MNGGIEVSKRRLIDADAIVKWAKENPEPVYPTWKEYFAMLYGSGLFGEPLAAIGKLCEESIPADIARKLGIEPKGWTA